MHKDKMKVDSCMMNNSKREIIRRTITVVTVFGFMFALIFIILFSKVGFDIGVKCPIYELLNWHCPFCGGTRMAVDLFEGDFIHALQNNGYILLTLPLILYVFFRQAYVYIRYGKLLEWLDVVIVAYVIGLVIYSILRNMKIFSWLAPIAVIIV